MKWLAVVKMVREFDSFISTRPTTHESSYLAVSNQQLYNNHMCFQNPTNKTFSLSQPSLSTSHLYSHSYSFKNQPSNQPTNQSSKPFPFPKATMYLSTLISIPILASFFHLSFTLPQNIETMWPEEINSKIVNQIPNEKNPNWFLFACVFGNSPKCCDLRMTTCTDPGPEGCADAEEATCCNDVRLWTSSSLFLALPFPLVLSFFFLHSFFFDEKKGKEKIKREKQKKETILGSKLTSGKPIRPMKNYAKAASTTIGILIFCRIFPEWILSPLIITEKN